MSEISFKQTIDSGFVGWANISNEYYHSIKDAVGSSQLKKILESPLEYKYSLTAPREDKSYFDLGQAMHSVILEQKTDRFICGPLVSSKATKEWKDAKAAAAEQGKILLDIEQYESVMRGFDVFCQHPMAHKLVSYCQKIEQSGFYKDEKSGLWCKFRPDGYCANDVDGDFIFDYKTAKAIDQRSIDNAIAAFGYHISAAHYIEGVKALTGREIKHYYLCFQKSHGSMDRVVKVLDEESIITGKALRDKALLMIADCQDKNYWPGLSEQIEGCGIAQWAHDKAGEFLTREVS